MLPPNSFHVEVSDLELWADQFGTEDGPHKPEGKKFVYEKNGSGHPTLSSPIAPSVALNLTTDKLTFFRHFDKDYLREQYVVQGKTMNQFARNRGCSRSTVRTALAELGFQIKGSKVGWNFNVQRDRCPLGIESSGAILCRMEPKEQC